MGGTNSTPPPPQSAPPPAQPAPAAAQPVPAPAAGSQVSSALSALSQAELMILGGSLLILVVDLVFSIVLDWYFIDELTFLLAAVALIAVVMTRFLRMSLPVDYSLLLVGSGLLLGVLGVRNLVWDLFIVGRRSSAQDVEYLLPALLLYVGIALVFFGAWRLWRGRTA